MIEAENIMPRFVAPRTMTVTGLRFLEALAAQHRSGCMLEIGPLFGSSTLAIHAGRRDISVPIHTIDTFESAPWVRKRLGLDLSRNAFDSFTAGIPNLNVHEGFAPDVVRDTWDTEIGFYFDDATHGDPGWTNNYQFFQHYFTDDAIICGDDFAGGWPDIVRNVCDITQAEGVQLFVIGRVWAFTRVEPRRIWTAIDDSFPNLRGCALRVRHGATRREAHAASWSWGLHLEERLDEAQLMSNAGLEIGLTIEWEDGSETSHVLGQEPIRFEGARRFTFAVPRGFSLQFCVRYAKGKTENTRDLRTGSVVELGSGDYITAIRLSHR